MAQRAFKNFKPWPAAFAVIGTVLAVFALIDLLENPAPYVSYNEQIATELANASTLPADMRVPLLNRLRDEQEAALMGRPAEPFGWARLAWLRLATGASQASAFAALRLSDQVSPGEPRQLPERALMWRQLRTVEDKDEQDYQIQLWQKAFRLQPEHTFKLASQNNLTDEVGEALKSDPELYGDWKARGNKSR